ncbi:type IV pili methyl-accepting chemotaxis transducer N-terminal domain-containing protein, partial [Granulosicoccus sp.]|nr:type IV pili methyl-accepting chemotaxis transducer N-terminal domain-containing protein [Granulosicoccus sp.]
MSLSTSLTLRYSIALVLVALILATTHMLSVKRIESSSADGHLIDTSGMQRMLSQRIGLLSLGMLSGRDNDGQSLADDLLKAINKMKANHNFLKEDWQERAEAGNGNFGRLLMADGLSDQVDIFLQEATDLYNRYLGVE